MEGWSVEGWTQIEVYCEGITPLLMDPADEDTLEGIRTGVRKPVVKDITREQQAKMKIYRENGIGSGDGLGKIGIPAENLWACLAEAGRLVPFRGKINISTLNSTLLPSFLIIMDDFLPLVVRNGDGSYEEIGEDGWKPDFRRGVNPNGGELVAIVRPRFPRWGFVAHILVDEKRANTDVVKRLFTEAGLAKGLCSFRPGKTPKGRFGMFVVRDWRVVDGATEAIATEEVAATTS